MLRLVSALWVVTSFARALPGRRMQDSDSLNWGICDYPFEKYTGPVECAKLAVPLDYTNANSNETIQLDLLKIRATKSKVLGSMLSNPGGPGSSGMQAANNLREALLAIGGGHYDLIGFDPRGTGRTMPYNSLSGLRWDAGNQIQDNLTQIIKSRKAVAIIEAEIAQRKNDKQGPLYGTVFVAQDMLRIVDMLAKNRPEDWLLNYYGASYGTLLGWTFAALFPERVGRMILDGVVNPVEYWNGTGVNLESVTDTNNILRNLVDACLKQRNACPLSGLGDTNSVSDQFLSTLSQWKYRDAL